MGRRAIPPVGSADTPKVAPPRISDQPEAVATLVRAAKSQTDLTAAIRLMDKARWPAAKCIEANRNECENAVLK